MKSRKMIKEISVISCIICSLILLIILLNLASKRDKIIAEKNEIILQQEELLSILEETKIVKGNKEIKRIDTNYKLFFGEWVVSKIIGINSRTGADADAENLLGTSFYYNYDVIKKNSSPIANNPNYYYYILPSSNVTFLKYMPLPSDVGINGEFSVYIEIVTDKRINEGTSFYIKDDNTLILFENNAFYEMKRKNYIKEDISEKYEHI